MVAKSSPARKSASKSKKTTKAAKGKRKKKSAGQELIEHQFEVSSDRMQVLQQILQFRQFLGSSFEPAISDSEIIVDISGIRGFDSPIRAWVNVDVDVKQDGFTKIK